MSDGIERLKREGLSMAFVRDQVAALRGPETLTTLLDPSGSPMAAETLVNAFRSDYLRKMREQMERLPFSERVGR